MSWAQSSPEDAAEELRVRIEDYLTTPSDRNHERVLESMRSYNNLFKTMPVGENCASQISDYRIGQNGRKKRS